MSPNTVMLPLKKPWLRCGSSPSSGYMAWAVSSTACCPTVKRLSCLQPWQNHSSSSGMLESSKQFRWNSCWQLSHMIMVSGLDCDPQVMQAVSGSIAGPVASDILPAWTATQAAAATSKRLWQGISCCTALCFSATYCVLQALILTSCCGCDPDVPRQASVRTTRSTSFVYFVWYCASLTRSIVVTRGSVQRGVAAVGMCAAFS